MKTSKYTAISFDAGTFGATLLPPDAYRFAREKEISGHNHIATT